MVFNTNSSEKGAVVEKLVPGKLLLSVLNGNYPKVSLLKSGTIVLEKLLTQVVLCTSDFRRQRSVKCYQRPKWWPKNLDFKFPITQLRSATYSSLMWNNFLRQLIAACSQFCDSQLTAKWRQEETKENVNRKKRKRSGTSLDCSKKQKIESSSSKTSRNNVLSAINTNSVLCVRLYDILKTPAAVVPPVVTQNEFLLGLGLERKRDNQRNEKQTIIPNIVKLAQVPHVVPFSSEYGRTVLRREKQPLPVEVHLRRIERIEWYTKDTRSSPSIKSISDYPATYDFEKDRACFHTYKFPRRQFYQGDSTLHSVSFLKSLCKPLTVTLTRIDCSKRPNRSSRNGVIKDLKVVIPRVNLKKLERRNPVVMLRRLQLKT